MAIDRRKFVTLGAGALMASRYINAETLAETKPVRSMLAPTKNGGFKAAVLMTTGDTIGEYRPPGIMDGMGAWSWDDNTVRLFVNHELPANKGYIWKLNNGTRLRGARISWFDIDKQSRQITAAGNAIKQIRDRNNEVVKDPAQIHEKQDVSRPLGLNTLCSGQGYRKGEYGFVDDIFFTHEEVSSAEDHPHGGSVWALDVRENVLWAAPTLGRGSWENVTALSTPDQDKADGHIALLLGDDLEFGGAPLYLWIGRKQPEGNFAARNGLRNGRLHVWKSNEGDRSPLDWSGTGTTRQGRFIPITTRDFRMAGKPGYDENGWLNDTTMRRVADEIGAFMFSRPEDLHTNPANGSQAVLCSTGHGDQYPTDDWGTIYVIDVQLNEEDIELPPDASLTILHDCDDFGDEGIRSADNVVWASDGMIYIQEDKANKINQFGGETGREASIWRINPEDQRDREVVAIIDRSVVLPSDAEDMKPDEIGAWECCGLLDVSEQFGTSKELLMITAIQAHSVRGGSLGDEMDLFQGGQLVLLNKRK